MLGYDPAMRGLTIVVLMAMVLSAVACAQDDRAPAVKTGSAEYVGAVEDLLRPPSRLASVTAERLAGEGTAVYDASGLADDARREHEEFRALRLASPVLRDQRDHLADGYAVVINALDPLVAAHASGNEQSLAAAARPFYSALQTLPASVPPPDAS